MQLIRKIVITFFILLFAIGIGGVIRQSTNNHIDLPSDPILAYQFKLNEYDTNWTIVKSHTINVTDKYLIDSISNLLDKSEGIGSGPGKNMTDNIRLEMLVLNTYGYKKYELHFTIHGDIYVAQYSKRIIFMNFYEGMFYSPNMPDWFLNIFLENGVDLKALVAEE